MSESQSLQEGTAWGEKGCAGGQNQIILFASFFLHHVLRSVELSLSGRAFVHPWHRMSGVFQPIWRISWRPMPSEALRTIGVPIWPRRRWHRGTSLPSGSRCTRGAPLCLIITQRRDDPHSRGSGAGTMGDTCSLSLALCLFAQGGVAG